MKLQQFIGPFTENINFNLSNVTYLKIGVEYPDSTPIIYLNDLIDNGLTIGINKESNQSHHDYIITTKDILELKMKKQNINVIFYKKNNPYVIVNALYEDS